jgi:hypothetical protein
LARSGRRAPSPPSKPRFVFADDALLADRSRFFREHPVVTLAAALLAGVLMGWEN